MKLVLISNDRVHFCGSWMAGPHTASQFLQSKIPEKVYRFTMHGISQSYSTVFISSCFFTFNEVILTQRRVQGVTYQTSCFHHQLYANQTFFPCLSFNKNIESCWMLLHNVTCSLPYPSPEMAAVLNLVSFHTFFDYNCMCDSIRSIVLHVFRL